MQTTPSAIHAAVGRIVDDLQAREQQRQADQMPAAQVYISHQLRQSGQCSGPEARAWAERIAADAPAVSLAQRARALSRSEPSPQGDPLEAALQDLRNGDAAYLNAFRPAS